jgi:hypothetical protein
MAKGIPNNGKRNKGWFKKGIVPLTAFKKGVNIGEKIKNWKGDDAGYRAFHYRVETRRGKPKFCEVCKTNRKKVYHWCNMTGDYANEMDYKRMCVSCHSEYDYLKRRFQNV